MKFDYRQVLLKFIHLFTKLLWRILGSAYYNRIKQYGTIKKFRGKLHGISVTYPIVKPSKANRMIFPGTYWEEASPESMGINYSKLKAAVNYLGKEFMDTGGISELIVIRNGYMILKGNNIHRQHNVWSVAKTFTSTALGLLLDDKKFNLNTLAIKYEPLLNKHYPTITLRHLATMTSGYDAVGFSDAHAHGDGRGDWGPDPYDVAPPLFQPGEKFCYHDEAMFMFGRILTRISNQTLHSLLKTRITDCIGMGHWPWSTLGEVNGIDINWGPSHVYLSAIQLARWGHLFLNRGNWNGKQLINPYWFDQISRNQVPTSIGIVTQRKRPIDGRGVYSYNWWLNGIGPDGAPKLPDTPSDTYWAAGFNNNMCFVIPSWNMVVVRMGTDGFPTDSDKTWNEFFRRLQVGIE